MSETTHTGLQILSENDPVRIDLYFHAEFCNAWPEIEIRANAQLVWKDFVIGDQKVSVEFPGAERNEIKVAYLNKRQGPDVWDTVVDADGNIVQDQHCILQSVLINGAKCDWLIDSLFYEYPDRPSKLNYGFMDAVGCMQFCFPQDVYQWVLDYRKSISPVNSRASSLDYKNIYIPQHENERSLQIIAEVKQILDQFDD